jgi:hypothetical protein
MCTDWVRVVLHGCYEKLGSNGSETEGYSICITKPYIVVNMR